VRHGGWPSGGCGIQDKAATTKPGSPGTPQDTTAAKPTVAADTMFMKTAAMDGMADRV
jgi:hypothetical protein